MRMYLAVIASCLTAVPAATASVGTLVATTAQHDTHVSSSGRTVLGFTHQRLHHGDQIVTRQASVAARVGNDAIVYAGPDSHLVLHDSSRLELKRGEIRVSSRNTNIAIVVPTGIVQLEGTGAARVALAEGAVFATCEAGTVRVLLASEATSAKRSSKTRIQRVSTRLHRRKHLLTTGNVCRIKQSGGYAHVPSYPWCVDYREILECSPCQPQQPFEDAADESEDAPEAPPEQSQDDYTPPTDTLPVAQSDTSTPTSRRSFSTQASVAGNASGTGISVGDGAGPGDANQQSLDPIVVPNGAIDHLRGQIHLLTSESAITFNQGPAFNASELLSFANREYWSIGQGASPGQITTDANTGTGATPNTIRIPGTSHYLVQLDQYGINDSVLSPTNSGIAITGLVGDPPTSPTVSGGSPLLDDRAQFNDTATFALGEFRVDLDNDGNPRLAIRRSDQDRLLIKDPNGNDSLDQATPNSGVEFDDVVDPRFLPQAPTVKVPRPNTFDSSPARFSQLDRIRRAAAITLTAEKLHGYAQRTKQTRFVVDGKIIDISGYQR